MKKLISIMLCLALALSLAPAMAESTVTLTDMAGREISLDAPATRVVALSAADCEILYAIGAGDTLVGRGEYCDYPEAVAALPSVNSGSETNIEQILALEPQAVVMSMMSQTKEQVQALEDAGVRVIVSDAQDVAGVYTAINLLGTLVGKTDEASALVDDMTAALAQIGENAEATGKTVYFEVSPLEYGLWTAGKGTFMNELAELCGLTNAFADLEGWQAISEEQVLERDPDYIVTLTMSYDGSNPVDEIKGRAGWENLKAIMNDDILNADNNAITRPGPRLVDAAQELADFADGQEEVPAA